jgi:heme-degrading monooxygenase HmoA
MMLEVIERRESVMPDAYTMGSWKPFPGQEDAFIEAWTEFASWATGFPGSGMARLARDLGEPDRFLSFLDWESIEAVRRWKSSPDFKERMSRVQKHIDKFAPTELEFVASCMSGAAVSTGHAR